MDKGKFYVDVTSRVSNTPINGARVTIAYSADPSSTIEELTTDSSGQSEVIELDAPPLDYSMSPSINQPYSEYTITVTANGFAPLSVSGSAIFANETSMQPIALTPEVITEEGRNIVIPANTLFGNFPPKIAEAEIKPINRPGEIVLSRVVVPEYVIVHDGVPSDSTANNYYVRYRDYIKNVACSEIYSTWPETTIRANILAIMSFSLNRVYTEWYRNQ